MNILSILGTRKPRTIRNAPAARRYRIRPCLEALEARETPAVVTNIGDDGGVNPLPFAGTGTLRQAIVDVNAHPGFDLIVFKLGEDTGVRTIMPLTPLPPLTDPAGAYLDGYSATGASRNTLAVGDNARLVVELNGALAGEADGLQLLGGNTRVEGLVINKFRGAGVRIKEAGNAVAGNFIGTDPTGRGAAGNGPAGVLIGDGSANTKVGGSNPGDRNVISGNRVGVLVSGASTLATTIAGNYVGTDAAGNAPLGNADAGVRMADGAQKTLVGGYTDGDRNVIGGNPVFNVEIVGPTTNFNTVAGNYIGVNAAGTTQVFATTGRGISIEGPTDGTMIGGTAPGARNVVSGNGLGVLFGAGARNVVIQGNYIGTDATGRYAVGNNNGVYGNNTTSDILIGGNTKAARNLISGNNEGVSLNNYGGYVHNVKIQGNWLGVDAAGSGVVDNGIGIQMLGDAPGAIQDVSNVVIDSNTIANSVRFGIDMVGPMARNNVVVGNSIVRSGWSGVMLQAGASKNLIGGTTGNEIAYNGQAGVAVSNVASYPGVPDGDSTGNTIRFNSIHDNGGLGIDLGNDGVTANDSGDPDPGPNRLQNYPVIGAVNLIGLTFVFGALNSAPGAYLVDLYASPAADLSGFGEGQVYLGSQPVTVGAFGIGVFIFVGPGGSVPRGWMVSATATRQDTGDTSEFSKAASPVRKADIVTAADSGELGKMVASAALAEGRGFVPFDPGFLGSVYVDDWLWGSTDYDISLGKNKGVRSRS